MGRSRSRSRSRSKSRSRRPPHPVTRDARRSPSPRPSHSRRMHHVRTRDSEQGRRRSRSASRNHEARHQVNRSRGDQSRRHWPRRSASASPRRSHSKTRRRSESPASIDSSGDRAFNKRKTSATKRSKKEKKHKKKYKRGASSDASDAAVGEANLTLDDALDKAAMPNECAPAVLSEQPDLATRGNMEETANDGNDVMSFFARLKQQEASKSMVGTLHASGAQAPPPTVATGEWECSRASCGHKNSKYAGACNKCGAMKRMSEWR